MRKSTLVTGLAVAALVGGMILTGGALAQKANKPDAAGKTGQKVAHARESHPLFGCVFDTLAILRQLKEDLNLTNDQMQTIRTITQAHKDEITTALTILDDKLKALLAAVCASKVDEAAIKAATNGMGDAISNASILRAKIQQEVLAVLTPEQRTQVAEALDAIQQNTVGKTGNK
jgi:Spy/CpxP family protein refolding chaperone